MPGLGVSGETVASGGPSRPVASTRCVQAVIPTRSVGTRGGAGRPAGATFGSSPLGEERVFSAADLCRTPGKQPSSPPAPEPDVEHVAGDNPDGRSGSN